MSAKNDINNNMAQRLLVMVILPMLLLAGATAIIGYNLTLSSLSKNLKNELKNTAAMTAYTIDTLVPGDYSLVGEGETGLSLMKGDTDITMRYDLVDDANALTDLEVSLIYSDTRILTTICNKEKVRIVGTGIASQVDNKLAESPEGVFFTKTLINYENYFSYYYPLHNSDDSFVGIIEVCSPYGPLSRNAWTTVLIIIAMIAFVTILLTVLIYQYNRSLEQAIEKLMNFTKQAAKGNDSVELDQALLTRDDEIGSIGASVLEMHRALRDMMDKDPLTKLFNRRSANRKLDIIRSHFTDGGKSYSVAIGDIDFFKKVNDTYGHDAGDIVLVTVADILQKHLKPLGFVARWGGEEFLMVFDKMEIKDAEAELWSILEEIRATEIEYEGMIIRVTMSFGVVSAPELTQDEIVKLADENLYYAKESGRNRVISYIPVSGEE